MEVLVLALFSAVELLADSRGQFALGVEVVAVAPPVAVEVAVMPAPWALIPREYITGQGVLGA